MQRIQYHRVEHEQLQGCSLLHILVVLITIIIQLSNLLLQFRKFRSVELKHAATAAVVIERAEFSNLHSIRPTSLINQNGMTIKTSFPRIPTLLMLTIKCTIRKQTLLRIYKVLKRLHQWIFRSIRHLIVICFLACSVLPATATTATATASTTADDVAPS